MSTSTVAAAAGLAYSRPCSAGSPHGRVPDLYQQCIAWMNMFLAQGYLDDMLQAWEHEFRQASGTERQQLGYRERLFFVAYDVVQMSSMAYRQLVTEKFTKPLELAFWLLSKMPGRNINKTIAKLPAVWRARNIFSARQIDKFEGILSGSAPEPLESMELREVEAVVENEDDETRSTPRQVAIQWCGLWPGSGESREAASWTLSERTLPRMQASRFSSVLNSTGWA